jgi:Zn-dependent protease with chaperone function
MHYSVYAGLGFAGLFGLIAPLIARRVAPAVATWLLTSGGLISAISAMGALGLLAMTLIGQDGTVASEGHWSIQALRHADPVRLPVALAALALVGVGVARLGWAAVNRSRAMAAAYRLNREVTDTGSDLVVLPDEAPDAYAVPGRPGRIYVTRGMLSLLSRAECDVMFAHERSHLRHHHHWHRSAALVASSLNPLLGSLPRTQIWLTERWADEDAARGNDRVVVASALRNAAAARGGTRPAGALGFTANTVEGRVAALLDDPPRRHPVMLALAAGVLLLSVMGTFDGVTDEAALFHSAVAMHNEPAHLRRLLGHGVTGSLLPVRHR